MDTPVAEFAGTVALTVGAVVSGITPVVRLHKKSAASALPARSVARALIVAVYVGRGFSLPAAATIDVYPLSLHGRSSDLIPCLRVKVLVLMVDASIASLKVPAS